MPHNVQNLVAPVPRPDRPVPQSAPPPAPAVDGLPVGVLKSALDLSLAVVLLVLTAPVMLATALAVKLTSAGPAFYSQTRVGRGGRHFRILKFRTMYHQCEQASGVKWSTPGDSRITKLGHFLRKSHLDELPQLINVLRGEMSLVGPRPERPEIIPTLVDAFPNYRDRLRVKPGVTGLAQLRRPADVCIPGVGRKLAYDLHYIRVRGPWLDVRLIACTGLKMLGLPLAGVLGFCGIPGDQAVGLLDDTQELPALADAPLKA